MTAPARSHVPTVSRRRLLASTAAVAALASTAAPAVAAPRPDRRMDFATDGIQAALDGIIAGGGVGATASVVGESGTFTAAAGRRQHRGGIAVPQDRARVASVTKGMVATLAMQEIEAGYWTLETTIDDVSRGLYPGRGDVTVAQLMNHTSGMPDYTVALFDPELLETGILTRQMLDDVVNRPYDERELLELSQTLPWSFEPGESWAYSNSGYVALSVMLEEATGSSLADLLRSRVFRPAGMHRSRIEETPLVRGRHLVPYAIVEGDEYVELDRMNPSVFSGAGGVYATAEDITDFTGALMTGELLPQELVDVMITPVGAAHPTLYGYGLLTGFGWVLGPDGAPEQIIGHAGTGFGTMTSSYTVRDGSRRVSVTWTGRDWLSLNPNERDMTVVYEAFAATAPEGAEVRPYVPAEVPTESGAEAGGMLQLCVWCPGEPVRRHPMGKHVLLPDGRVLPVPGRTRFSAAVNALPAAHPRRRPGPPRTCPCP